MKFKHISTLSIFLMNLLSCGATILVRFGQLGSHYLKNMEQGSDTESDPLSNFGSQGRQVLCDAVINAKEFMVKYTSPQYMKRIIGPRHSLTDFNLENNDGIREEIINYQRWGPLSYDQDPSFLKYIPRSVRIGSTTYLLIRSLQCVNTSKTKWFVTYGLVDKLMYLLEVRTDHWRWELRITGLFEPSAVIDEFAQEYFRRQFKMSGDMTELVCNLNLADRLRLCGAVFDALSPAKSSTSKEIKQIHLKKERHPCIVKKVEVNTKSVPIKIMRCSFIYKTTSTTLFHILADVRERGAVFVFRERNRAALELYARVRKVGALLRPFDSDTMNPQTFEANSKKDRTSSKRKRSTDVEDFRDSLHGFQNKEDCMKNKFIALVEDISREERKYRTWITKKRRDKRKNSGNVSSSNSEAVVYRKN